jgi:uroporphyrinogen decarboxylase
MDPLLEDFYKTARHERASRPPVALFNVAPFTTTFTGAEINAYYRDPALKMAAQLKLMRMLPGIILVPALWADFGPALECSSLGSEILWLDHDPPFAKRAIDSYEAIDALKPSDPKKDGLMPLALDHYRYMWDHVERQDVDRWGCLDGVAVTVGPVEISGLLTDFQNFFLGFYDAPVKIKKLLEIVTESVLRWIRAQEKVNGRLKQLVVIDHMPAQISADAFEEFCFPYLSRIFSEYSYAVRIYHNEGNVTHILPRIADMGVDVFHFGIEAGLAKRAIGDRVVLMGNVHPVNVLLNQTASEVKEAALRCLRAGAPGGNFILSSGGGLAPATPWKNLEAMVEAARSFIPPMHDQL